MLTLPVAQLVNCRASNLKVGDLRPVKDTSRLILFSLVSDGSLTNVLLTSCCHKQDTTIPFRNFTGFLQNVATLIQCKTKN